MVPALYEPKVRKVDGGQMYITGKERRPDEAMAAQGWWLTVLKAEIRPTGG